MFFNDEVNCQYYTASVTDERSTGGMILTRENQSTLRKTCPIASLSTTDSPLIGLNPNPSLGGEKPVTNCQNHATAFWDDTPCPLVNSYPCCRGVSCLSWRFTEPNLVHTYQAGRRHVPNEALYS